jgi:tRNA-specific 2-thiouridylase
MILSVGRKAIGLLSGGLDSRLAVKMMQEQGIEVIAFNFVTPFCNCTSKGSCKTEARKASEEFGIELRVVPLFEEFMEVVKHPRYGYGRGINPCLDCRILMFKMAAEYMKEEGASFIVTGEVLGERPMSQRIDAIRTIERDSGMEGLVVRPLSARLFEPTIPEREGWIDREKLLAISGRSRKPQIQLAKDLDLKDYPCPAGGCLLTDKHFADKLRRLLAKRENPDKNDILLLKVGRHFESPSGSQIVIGRNEAENNRLEQLKKPQDWVLAACESLGPTAVVRGPRIEDADLELAAKITAGYGKGRDEATVDVACRRSEGEQEIILQVEPVQESVTV